MKRRILLLLGVAIVFFSTASAGQSSGRAVTLAAANNEFALELYQRLRLHEGNLVLSPYSISTALAMTYAGARGRTEQEMAQVLHFTLGQQNLHEAFQELRAHVEGNRRSEELQLYTANSLWRQEGYRFLDLYLQLLQQLYEAVPSVVDFVHKTEEARLAINGWVEEKTAGKIVDLIRPGLLTPATTLVLCNAIYFKGLWVHQFDPKQTVNEEFHVSPSTTVLASMMRQMARLRFRVFDSCTALELPYEGRLSMILFLPDARDGLSPLEERLTRGEMAEWLSELISTDPTPVRVSVPKFISTSMFELADTLAAMGMPHAFHGADFSGMTGNCELFISNVVHQAFIEVHEQGTEAAASTAVVMKRGGVNEFVADHPFLFLIIDKETGSFLFMGRVIDPSA